MPFLHTFFTEGQPAGGGANRPGVGRNGRRAAGWRSSAQSNRTRDTGASGEDPAISLVLRASVRF